MKYIYECVNFFACKCTMPIPWTSVFAVMIHVFACMNEGETSATSSASTGICRS